MHRSRRVYMYSCRGAVVRPSQTQSQCREGFTRQNENSLGSDTKQFTSDASFSLYSSNLVELPKLQPKVKSNAPPPTEHRTKEIKINNSPITLEHLQQCSSSSAAIDLRQYKFNWRNINFDFFLPGLCWWWGFKIQTDDVTFCSPAKSYSDLEGDIQCTRTEKWQTIQ